MPIQPRHDATGEAAAAKLPRVVGIAPGPQLLARGRPLPLPLLFLLAPRVRVIARARKEQSGGNANGSGAESSSRPGIEVRAIHPAALPAPVTATYYATVDQARECGRDNNANRELARDLVHGT